MPEKTKQSVNNLPVDHDDQLIEKDGKISTKKVKEVISRAPATESEKEAIAFIKSNCSQLISTLKYPTDDVIGEWRMLRFVRNSKGDKKKATKQFTKFLDHRLAHNHLTEEMGHEMRGKSPQEFQQWFKLNRSLCFPFNPYAGETDDGRLFVWTCNIVNFDKFLTEESFMEQFFITTQVNEWLLWYLNEMSKKHNKLCYVTKLMDCDKVMDMGPMMNSEFRKYMGMSLAIMAIDYCDGDDFFYSLRPPTIFKVMTAIFRVFLSSRQKAKCGVLNSDEEIQDVMPAAFLPKTFGGQGNDYLTEMCYTEFSDENYKEHNAQRKKERGRWAAKLPLDVDEFNKYYK